MSILKILGWNPKEEALHADVLRCCSEMYGLRPSLVPRRTDAAYLERDRWCAEMRNENSKHPGRMPTGHGLVVLMRRRGHRIGTRRSSGRAPRRRTGDTTQGAPARAVRSRVPSGRVPYFAAAPSQSDHVWSYRMRSQIMSSLRRETPRFNTRLLSRSTLTPPLGSLHTIPAVARCCSLWSY